MMWWLIGGGAVVLIWMVCMFVSGHNYAVRQRPHTEYLRAQQEIAKLYDAAEREVNNWRNHA